MKDLDEYELKMLADYPSCCVTMGGTMYVAVPLELLQRVTSHFDVRAVEIELGRRKH